MNKKAPAKPTIDLVHPCNIYSHLIERKEQRYQVQRTYKVQQWLRSQY